MNENIKKQEDEKVFSGSRIRHYSFADFIIVFRGDFYPLQCILCITKETVRCTAGL